MTDNKVGKINIHVCKTKVLYNTFHMVVFYIILIDKIQNNKLITSVDIIHFKSVNNNICFKNCLVDQNIVWD